MGGGGIYGSPEDFDYDEDDDYRHHGSGSGSGGSNRGDFRASSSHDRLDPREAEHFDRKQ